MIFVVEKIGSNWIDDIGILCVEARAEGFRFVDRLVSEWHAGTQRFDRPCEGLFQARTGHELAGIGGITIDPVVPDALRMRRFYVRAPYRQLGLGRMLAMAALHCRDGHIVTVNADPLSFGFWQRLGFVPDACDGHTHILGKSARFTPADRGT
jgi:GNAT superfamily N-acetyltransferase